jgi:hypothetical protein
MTVSLDQNHLKLSFPEFQKYAVVYPIEFDNVKLNISHFVFKL